MKDLRDYKHLSVASAMGRAKKGVHIGTVR